MSNYSTGVPRLHDMYEYYQDEKTLLGTSEDLLATSTKSVSKQYFSYLIYMNHQFYGKQLRREVETSITMDIVIAIQNSKTMKGGHSLRRS